MDLLAAFLRRAPAFKGRGRVQQFWLDTRRGRRVARLPGGLVLNLDMTVAYEAMIWIGFEERQELAALPDLLGPGDVFLDCGANIGLWSLAAAPLVGRTGLVQAFEANAITATRLREHAQQSAVIDVRNVALTDAPGEVSLDIGDSHNVTRVSPTGTVRVVAARLDDELVRPPTGIKIDVEGLELAVLHGATAALKHRPWVVVEFNKDYGPQTLGVWPVHRLLVGLGYRASLFDGADVDDQWSPPHGYANVLYRAYNRPL